MIDQRKHDINNISHGQLIEWAEAVTDAILNSQAQQTTKTTLRGLERFMWALIQSAPRRKNAP